MNQPGEYVQFQLSKPDPKGGVSGNGKFTDPKTGVTFTITAPSHDPGKFFSFSVAGAKVYHVGVNGGTNTAWYDYVANTSAGYVSADTDLHATKQSATKFYVASITTFCYVPEVTTISGRVFFDHDSDGAWDSTGSPADAGLGGWDVSLYRTSSPAGQVGSAITTGSDGLYTFEDVQVGPNYKVCVVPAAGSGTWGQTTPEGTDCSTQSSATPAGHVIAPLSGPAENMDFGAEQTVIPSCTDPFSAPLIGTGTGIVDYRAQLTAPPGTEGCKDSIVMYSYLDGTGVPYATIHPPASSTNTTDYWVVERIRWNVDKDGAQNPVTLKYDDFKPYGDLLVPMLMCTADPRATNEEFQVAVNPADVMPDGGHTSCMIQSTDFPSGNAYNYEAYTVSLVDGLKTPVG